jgi:hypothetical protein
MGRRHGEKTQTREIIAVSIEFQSFLPIAWRSVVWSTVPGYNARWNFHRMALYEPFILDGNEFCRFEQSIRNLGCDWLHRFFTYD